MRPLRVLAALIVAAAPFASQADTIKLTIPGENANFAQYFIAHQRGYFKQEGLDVEIIIMGGGPATPALIAGSTQYSASSSSAMTAALKGANLQVILVGQDRPIYEFWSFDPAVKTFEQLKGKLILVTSRGGSDDIALRMYLRSKGLPIDYFGVTAIGGGAPVRIAAVTAGSQKYVSLTRTERDELRAAGVLAKGTMIFSPAKEIQLTLGGLATTDEEIRKNRDRVKRMLRAIWKGTIVMLTNKEMTIDEMQKRLPKTAHNVVVRDAEGGIEDVNPTGVIAPDAQAKELAARAELLGVPPDKIPPLEKIYDFSIAQEVIAELKQSGWKP
jgi:ABC-type nitrate/sulfonate/bicarbonate transport system substrate-binding protein